MRGARSGRAGRQRHGEHSLRRRSQFPRAPQALNLRQYASTGSKVLAKLYNGTRLWVNAQGSEWCQVTNQANGMTGYVMTAYIQLHNLPSTPWRTVRPSQRELCKPAFFSQHVHQQRAFAHAQRRVGPGAHSRLGMDQGFLWRHDGLYAHLFPEIAARRYASASSRNNVMHSMDNAHT